MNDKIPKIPTLADRNHPMCWHSHRPVRWYDDEGGRHKTSVIPIKRLSTNHLLRIMQYKDNGLTKLEPGSVLYNQVMNVVNEYKRRLPNGKQ